MNNGTHLNIVQEAFQGWKTNPGQMSDRNVFHVKYNDVTKKQKKRLISWLLQVKRAIIINQKKYSTLIAQVPAKVECIIRNN